MLFQLPEVQGTDAIELEDSRFDNRINWRDRMEIQVVIILIDKLNRLRQSLIILSVFNFAFVLGISVVIFYSFSEIFPFLFPLSLTGYIFPLTHIFIFAFVNEINSG